MGGSTGGATGGSLGPFLSSFLSFFSRRRWRSVAAKVSRQ